MNEVAGQVVPTMAEKGLEGFIEYYLVLAHELEEIKDWAKYAEYFKANHKRILSLSKTKTTIENARQYFPHRLLTKEEGSNQELDEQQVCLVWQQRQRQRLIFVCAIRCVA